MQSYTTQMDAARKGIITPEMKAVAAKEYRTEEEIRDLVMAHPAIIGIHDLIVHDYGPGRLMVSLHAEVPADGDLLTLPAYMQFLLDLEPEEVILETIDTDELTRMAREFLNQK